MTGACAVLPDPPGRGEQQFLNGAAAGKLAGLGIRDLQQSAAKTLRRSGAAVLFPAGRGLDKEARPNKVNLPVVHALVRAPEALRQLIYATSVDTALESSEDYDCRT